MLTPLLLAAADTLPFLPPPVHTQLSTYSEPLHQLQAVTEANLKYDLFDSMQMT
jgi:hypothetical protein